VIDAGILGSAMLCEAEFMHQQADAIIADRARSTLSIVGG